MKKEFKVIAELLPKNVRVLDVGCGDGSLMDLLIKEKNIEARGLEIKEEYVKKCIYKGLSVIEGNAETELLQFPDQSFDYVVLSQTLQAFYNPEKSFKGIIKGWKIGNCIYSKFWLLESENKLINLWKDANDKNFALQLA